MQLVDQGKISLDAPVARYVPDFSMLRMSTARSTTQIKPLSRRSSSQIAQGDFSVNAPQVEHN